jgi:hypothetical protein
MAISSFVFADILYMFWVNYFASFLQRSFSKNEQKRFIYYYESTKRKLKSWNTKRNEKKSFFYSQSARHLRFCCSRDRDVGARGEIVRIQVNLIGSKRHLCAFAASLHSPCFNRPVSRSTVVARDPKASTTMINNACEFEYVVQSGGGAESSKRNPCQKWRVSMLSLCNTAS